MRLASTRHSSPVVSFREALFKGQAPDGGLYTPVDFPQLDYSDIKNYGKKSYKELAFYVLDLLLGDEFQENALENVVNFAYTFSPALHNVDFNTNCLELFHGPTLSFKDFGAQFMAKSMGYFIGTDNREITILVATSGDTGSAVAHAYLNVPGIRIVLLYPSGKVSLLQEKQLSTLSGNIFALEVQGTFDDCQALVKKAFSDDQIKDKITLSSANSINIGRLLPQSIYYFWSVSQLIESVKEEIVVCVPSGNFGNLCAGLYAQQMGLPVFQFIAAVNSNSVISEYVQTGEYNPRPSIRTLSNAMDVGNPSNWERISSLFNNSYQVIKKHIWSTSVNDRITLERMKKTFNRCNYIVDPHTAVGLEAAQRYRHFFSQYKELPIVSLSTAHVGKFQDIVSQALDFEIELPEALSDCIKMDKKAASLRNSYEDFKEFLWELS